MIPPDGGCVRSAGILELLAFVLVMSVASLSFVSLGFILRFRRDSLTTPSLSRFSPLWTVRLLLVSAAILWSATQLLVPLFGPNPLLCRLRVTLSLGLLEPAILLTVFFLLSSSTAGSPLRSPRVVSAVLLSCLPVLVLQTVLFHFSPLDGRLPDLFTRSSYPSKEDAASGQPTACACAYPLLPTIVFSSFGAVFWACFAVSCHRVVTTVINKGLRTRTFAIALGVLVPLPAKVALLGLSATWMPETGPRGGAAEFGALVCMLVSVAAAEGVLVIKPILDALDAGGGCGRFDCGDGDGDGGEGGRPGDYA